jgi:hypothetical protein
MSFGERMRSYVDDFAEALFPWSQPGSGKTSLGVWRACTWCEGRGYLKKNANVWRPCSECYGGSLLGSSFSRREEFAESGLRQKKKHVRPIL